MAQNSTRKSIVGGIARLQRPEGISPTRWRGVHAYLMAIASHYPKAFPSQEKLAEEVECSLRSIRGYQVLCQRLGLLHVTADAGAKGKHHTWSKTHRYHILIPAESAGPIPANIAYKVPSARYACLQQVASLSHSTSERTQPRPPSAGSNVTPMRRDQEPSSEVPRKRAPAPRKSASDLLTPGANRRQAQRVPARKQRWQVLAEYFTLQWHDLQSHPANRDLRGIRDVENQGQCRSYINSRFKDSTDDEVRAYIDEFMRLVTQRHVRIKDGQSAWMCFTGSWGRKRAIDTSNPTVHTYVPPSERAQ